MLATSTARLGETVRRTRLALATTVVLLFPFVGLPREEQRATLPVEYSYFYLADIALIAVALLTLPALIGTVRRPRGIEGALWLALYALLFIAFALNPGARGLDILIRLVAGAALYRVIADADAGWRRRVAAALGATACVQAVVSLLQVMNGAPLGLTALGELQQELVYRGGVGMATGTIGNGYVLAALAILTAVVLSGESLRSTRSAAWLVPAAIAISTAGLIYGRAVALAFALAWGSFVPAAVRDPRYRPILAALLLGFALTAIAFNAGWAQSFSRGVSSPRGEMLVQAAAITQEEPFFGVGPGNYVEALRARPELHTRTRLLEVHNVPALLAAEAGVPAGIVSAALLVLVGLRSLRAGPFTISLYASFSLWVILDKLPYETPQGVVLSALWLAYIRHAEKDPP